MITASRLGMICGVPSYRVAHARAIGSTDPEIFQRYRRRPHLMFAMLGAREVRTRVRVIRIHSPFAVECTSNRKAWRRVHFAIVVVDGEGSPRPIAIERLRV